jgi:hypothetical protein
MSESLQNITSSINVKDRWVDTLFDAYELFPYLDTSERTSKTLAARTLTSKIADVAFQRANLRSLLSALSLIDMSLISESQGSLLGESYRILETHFKEKETLVDRINKIRRDLEKRRLSFAGVQFRDSPVEADFIKRDGRFPLYLRPFYEKRVESDRQFIAISGQLCSTAAIQAAGSTALPKTLERSDIRWMLADLPTFAFSHPDFQEGVLLIEIPPGILSELEKEPPFSSDVGWYPYVRIYGHVRASYSPGIGYPVLQFSWMEYRKPKIPAQVQESILKAYADKTAVRDLIDKGFAVNKTREVDVLLFLQVLRIMQRALQRTLSELPLNIQKIVQDAYGRLSPESQKLVPELKQSP